MWKDKEGNKLTTKEFFSRWKKGIQEITPVQKLKNDLFSAIISFIGFIGSIVVLILFRKEFIVSWFSYMLILIFVGSAWSSGIKILMIKQQLKLFKNVNSSSLNIVDILNNLKESEIKEETLEVLNEERDIKENEKEDDNGK